MKAQKELIKRAIQIWDSQPLKELDNGFIFLAEDRDVLIGIKLILYKILYIKETGKFLSVTAGGIIRNEWSESEFETIFG